MFFAIVVSRFYETLAERLLMGAVERFAELGVEQTRISVASVPGAVEIPVVAQRFAKQGRYLAIVCLGAVIRGETTHYDCVCQQVSYGCQRVALDYAIPVIFGVLTTDNMMQATDRLGGRCGHKGREAADTAVTMVSCLESVGSFAVS